MGGNYKVAAHFFCRIGPLQLSDLYNLLILLIIESSLFREFPEHVTLYTLQSYYNSQAK